LLAFQQAQPVHAAEKRRIYFLESLSPAQPAAVRLMDAFQKRLAEKTSESFEIFADFMELVRFPGQAHIDRTVKYLSEKYAENPPDLLIAMGRAAIPFISKYRDTFAPNVPIIVASVPYKELSKTALPSDLFFVATEYNFAETFKLARRLQPGARNVVVVGGSGDYDRQWLDDARRDLQPFSNQYAIKFLSDVPYEQMLSEVSGLPKDTILIVSFFFVDASGQPHVSPLVVDDVIKVAPVPAYSPVSSFLARGIVGGKMDSWEQQGFAAADLALEILSGKNLAELPHQILSPQSIQVDERQIKRWKLREANLPPGTDVQFHQPDLWQQYWWEIITIFGVLLVQAAIITALFVERHWRRNAEENLRQRLLEVMHLNRSAVAGALSASVAHELNQPLAAIQSYAEAASLYLRANPPNLERVQKILENIRQDDKRAADIISHFRSFLKRREQSELEEFDLNRVVDDAVQVVRSEALRRGIEVEALQVAGPLPVRGDHIQLQQVVLNLAMNGLDAMQGCPPGKGKMSVQTAVGEDSTVEVTVADSGTGIQPDKLNQIFEAFYTTKRQGTGLGLAIARTIIESYGGKIWVENHAGGGAVFRFALPLSRMVMA
jgi:signal transduction histidine kinase